jgi:molybdenum cofactor cytidylyltransferase
VIGAVLLAAGSSRRFGGDKLLAPLADGTPIGFATASTLVATLPSVVAVVRPGAAALAAGLRACGAEIVICPRADEGMGTSLAWGVAATAGWSGWVVALADMPFVQPATVGKLVAAVAGGAALAAPRYEGKRGHPVCFGASYREALLALTGDRGGRELLRAAGDRLHLVDCDDPGVLADIDTPAELERVAPRSGTPLPHPASK